MSVAHEGHFTGTIEQVLDEDDGVCLLIRRSHEIRRITGARAPMALFLEKWAEAGCPRVHVHSDGSIDLVGHRGSHH